MVDMKKTDSPYHNSADIIVKRHKTMTSDASWPIALMRGQLLVGFSYIMGTILANINTAIIEVCS